MAKFTPCPVCGARAVYLVGGVMRIRRHSPIVGWRETPWCPAGGRSFADAFAEFAPPCEVRR